MLHNYIKPHTSTDVHFYARALIQTNKNNDMGTNTSVYIMI